ncbi:unnamed protein product [Sympodiomycopsis kandeliae]
MQKIGEGLGFGGGLFEPPGTEGKKPDGKKKDPPPQHVSKEAAPPATKAGSQTTPPHANAQHPAHEAHRSLDVRDSVRLHEYIQEAPKLLSNLESRSYDHFIGIHRPRDLEEDFLDGFEERAFVTTVLSDFFRNAGAGVVTSVGEKVGKAIGLGSSVDPDTPHGPGGSTGGGATKKVQESHTPGHAHQDSHHAHPPAHAPEAKHRSLTDRDGVILRNFDEEVLNERDGNDEIAARESALGIATKTILKNTAKESTASGIQSVFRQATAKILRPWQLVHQRRDYADHDGELAERTTIPVFVPAGRTARDLSDVQERDYADHDGNLAERATIPVFVPTGHTARDLSVVEERDYADHDGELAERTTIPVFVPTGRTTRDLSGISGQEDFVERDQDANERRKIYVATPYKRGIPIVVSGRDQVNERGIPVVISGRDQVNERGIPVVISGRDQVNERGIPVVISGRDQFNERGIPIVVSGRDQVNERGGIPVVISGRDGVPVEFFSREVQGGANSGWIAARDGSAPPSSSSSLSNKTLGADSVKSTEEHGHGTLRTQNATEEHGHGPAHAHSAGLGPASITAEHGNGPAHTSSATYHATNSLQEHGHGHGIAHSNSASNTGTGRQVGDSSPKRRSLQSGEGITSEDLLSRSHGHHKAHHTKGAKAAKAAKATQEGEGEGSAAGSSGPPAAASAASSSEDGDAMARRFYFSVGTSGQNSMSSGMSALQSLGGHGHGHHASHGMAGDPYGGMHMRSLGQDSYYEDDLATRNLHLEDPTHSGGGAIGTSGLHSVGPSHGFAGLHSLGGHGLHGTAADLYAGHTAVRSLEPDSYAGETRTYEGDLASRNLHLADAESIHGAGGHGLASLETSSHGHDGGVHASSTHGLGSGLHSLSAGSEHGLPGHSLHSLSTGSEHGLGGSMDHLIRKDETSDALSSREVGGSQDVNEELARSEGVNGLNEEEARGLFGKILRIVLRRDIEEERDLPGSGLNEEEARGLFGKILRVVLRRNAEEERDLAADDGLNHEEARETWNQFTQRIGARGEENKAMNEEQARGILGTIMRIALRSDNEAEERGVSDYALNEEQERGENQYD